MITFDRDIVFLDTETLGLDRRAPIWEFAAVRLRGNEIVSTEECFVGHDHGYGTNGLPEVFAADYRTRYDADVAVSPAAAAKAIATITSDAIVAGSNPSFDMDRLGLLLRHYGYEPGWHYHPLDIPPMVVGQVARSVVAASVELGDEVRLTLPWNSSQLSRRLSVDPDDFARHTAMGDVQWCLAQWRVMNGVSA